MSASLHWLHNQFIILPLSRKYSNIFSHQKLKADPINRLLWCIIGHSPCWHHSQLLPESAIFIPSRHFPMIRAVQCHLISNEGCKEPGKAFLPWPDSALLCSDRHYIDPNLLGILKLGLSIAKQCHTKIQPAIEIFCFLSSFPIFVYAV